MDRRDFLKTVTVGTGLIAGGPLVSNVALGAATTTDHYVKDYLNKQKNFDQHHWGDVYVRHEDLPILHSVTKRLKRLQSVVGYANFALLSFDKALAYARNYSQIGEFSKREQDFIEEIFYTNSTRYGFYGEKVLTHLTDSINDRDAQKMPGTGQHLLKGDPIRFYNRIKKDVGDSIVLTSGIRGIVKQMYLFLNKTVKKDGNLSLASRSLAPPGHSFHGIGDFDVGKVGFGYRNFTEAFAHTDEYRRLQDLGYIKIRYPTGNPYGVRFEPWHIKVVTT